MKLISYVNQRRGAASELARRIGVAPILVTQWAKNQRPVPARRCTAIEIATKGAITRQELRPDDYWLIWPDLPAPTQETEHV